MAANIPAHIGTGFSKTTQNFGPENWQKLDIYTPNHALDETPVVIFFYGGRWESGTRGEYAFIGATMAQHDYITVIPDYQKYPAVHFPQFVQDGAEAVAWVHQHYPGHDIFIMGHSAGAHIGALLTADTHYLAAVNLDAYSVIKGFIGLSGPYDFTPDEPDLKDMFGPPGRYPQMQVTNFITGREPPMLLLWGQDDKDVGAFNHEKLAARIRAMQGRVQVITYPDVDHTGMLRALSAWGRSDSPIRRDVFDFLAEHSVNDAQ